MIEMNKSLLISFTILCLLSTVVLMGLALNIQPVKASGTIYIRADGSIDPDTAPIQLDGNIYTFTDNIYHEIVVESDNIVVDGAGYTLQGTGAWGSTGISLSGRNNVTMNNMKIKMFNYGIYLYESSNSTISGNNITNCDIMGISLISSSNYNSISGNNITNCDYGIYVWESSDNTISKCQMTNNGYFGIILEGSSNNSISGNNITNNDSGIALTYSELEPHYSSKYNSVFENKITANNDSGIYIYESSSNSVYHNQFGNNTRQIYTYNSVNVWDNGVEGNYWSNYTGVDLDSDGIGDSPLVIDENNQDNYPLMGMFSDFDVTPEHRVTTVSNSSISDFQFNVTAFYFNVTGEDGTTGFCRISIPTALLNGTYKLYINSTEVPYTQLPCSNITHSYLYFAYDHSTQNVVITTVYYELLNQFLKLFTDFNSLNSTYQELLNDYLELQSNHSSLNSTYNNLQTAYDNLQTSYNELQSDQEAVINELNNIRNTMYIFITTTIILMATTVYFAIRKPKIKP